MVLQLVVGLGNPGAEYAVTRHNIGFRVVDELARRGAVARWQRRAASRVAAVELGGGVVLAKPETYMNRSGVAVLSLSTSLGITPQSILVVTDDVDLQLGRLRLRRHGGPGTHNGLRDVVSALGTDFPRLRVGVRGELPWDDLADYVLAPFEADEQGRVDQAVGRAADAVEVALLEGLGPAMNRFNRASPDW